MRALRALAHGPEQLRLVEVPDVVQLDGDEVLVETRAVGVCGSDIHAWHGTQTYPMTFPVTLGHEATGIVSRLGPQATHLAEGVRVVSETARFVCGRCALCREGRYNLCQDRLGFGAKYDGAMADSFVTRQPILHVVPDNLPDEVAALTEPYCVAFNAMVERARVRPGDTVSVIGPGTVGIFSAEIALLSGAAEVVVIGAPGDEPRLQLAEETGATATLIADNPKWWEEAELSSTSDVVIDASGVSATLEAALELVRAGGQVVKVGWGPETYGRPLDLIVAKAVNLHGAFSHTWSTWERVLKLLGTGRLDPRKALRTYSLQDWEMAFGAMADRTILKAVLVP